MRDYYKEAQENLKKFDVTKYKNNAPAGECSYCWEWIEEGETVCPNLSCPSHKEDN